MVKLRALKTFSAGGAHLTFQGEEFDAPKERAEEYKRLKLAEDVHNPDEGQSTAPDNLNSEFAEEIAQRSEDLRQANSDEDGSNEEEARPVMAPPPISDYTEEELSNKSMKELKNIAKNIGVKGYSTVSKAELIFMIRAQQNQNNAMEV
jgi:Rho termination factor, N-terminal domain